MIKKIKYIILFSILTIWVLCTKSEARITTSDPTVESGGTATITINSQEPVAYGAIDVTANGGLTFVSVDGGTANGTKVAFSGTENKTSGLATYKFKVPTVTQTTTYKVEFTSMDMGNASLEEVASSSATATVTVKPKQTSSGSSGGSSGSGSQGSGNNSTPSTPSISFTDANETMYVTTESSVNFRTSYSTSSGVIGALSNGTKVTVIGKATKAVDGITWYKIQYNGSTGYVSSQYLTSKEPKVEEKSNNNDLKSLTVGAYELTPEFSSDVTEYNLKVDENVDVLQVEAEPEDENAEVEVTGNDNLLMGTNKIEIKVTAEDETVKTYIINVTKGEEPKIQLNKLEVVGYTLTPEFASNVYEYTLTINDVNVKSLEINTTSNEENAKIEVLGNEDLKLGKNIITILVESEDSEVSTYQIVVNIEEKAQEVAAQIIPGIDDNDLFLYGGIAIGVLIIIIIIAIIVSKRRQKDDYDFDTFNAEFKPIDEKVKDDNSSDKKEERVDNNNNKAEKEEKVSKRKSKKDLIEENFGENVNNSDVDIDKSKKKSGKHF